MLSLVGGIEVVLSLLITALGGSLYWALRSWWKAKAERDELFKENFELVSELLRVKGQRDAAVKKWLALVSDNPDLVNTIGDGLRKKGK